MLHLRSELINRSLDLVKITSTSLRARTVPMRNPPSCTCGEKSWVCRHRSATRNWNLSWCHPQVRAGMLGNAAAVTASGGAVGIGRCGGRGGVG